MSYLSLDVRSCSTMTQSKQRQPESLLFGILLWCISIFACTACDNETKAPATFDVLIEASALKINAPSEVSFEAINNGPLDGVYQYTWQFGDLGESDEESPIFLFESEGLYTVNVLVVDENSGAQGEASLEIEVLPEISLALSSLNVNTAGSFVAGDELTVSWISTQEGGETVRAWESIVFIAPAQPDGSAPALEVDLPGERVRWSEAQGVSILTSLPHASGGEGGMTTQEVVVTLPDQLESGEYYIGVYLDDEGVVGDQMRSDNLALSTVPLRVRNPLDSGPDLQVCGIDIPIFAQVEPGQRPVIIQGEQMEVTLCLANAGDQPIIDTPYALYLSKDNELDEEDTLLDRATDQALGSNDRFTRELIIDIPFDATPEVYRLIAVIDPADGISERAEDNNTRVSTVPFEIVEPGEVEGVDLVVVSASVNEERVFWGQLLTGTIVLLNRGTVDVERLFVARLNALPVDGGIPVQLPSINLSRIAAGEELEIPFELALTRRVNEGIYRLQVEIDPTNSTGDVNPGNNRRSLPDELQLGGDPNFDPAAVSVTLDTNQIDAGDTLNATLILSNLGDDPTGSFEALIQLTEDARIDVNDPEIIRLQIDSLEGNEEREITVELTIPQNLDQAVMIWRVGLSLDPESRLSGERTTTNNQIVTEPILTVVGATGGCGEDDYEENDSASQASTLTAGIYENLGVCDASDWFATEVPAQDIFELRVAWDQEQGTPTLELANSSGDIVRSAERRGDELALFVAPQAEARRVLYRITGGGARLGYSLSSSLNEVQNGLDVRLSQLKVNPALAGPGSPVELTALASHLGEGAQASGTIMVSLVSAPRPSAELEEDQILADLGSFELPNLSSGTSLEVSSRVTMPEAVADGLYYVLIELEGVTGTLDNWSWAVTPLRVNASDACTSDLFEPNGSPYEDDGVSQSAYEITPGNYENLYSCEGDDDWYRVRVEEGEALNASITFNRFEGDLDLVLYAPDGVTIIDESLTLQNSETVDLFRASEAGDYLLRVYLNPTDELNSSTQYQLDVEVGPSGSCGDDGFEPNGSPQEAAPLPDGTHTLNVCPGGEDWFRFNIPAGNTMSIQVDSGIGDVELALFDPDDILVEINTRRITFTANITGSHRLRVTPISQDEPAPYILTVGGVSGVDLAIEDLVLTSTIGAPGDELLGRAVISNLRGDSAEQVIVRFTLSQDARPTGDDLLLGEQLIPSVAGASTLEITQRLTIPAEALTGTQQLIVEIDPLRTLPDIRTGNNVARASFEVIGVCIDDDERENEGPATATELQTTSGSIEAVICAYTEDWYSLEAQAGTLLVNLGAQVGAGDLDLSIYRASDGALLEASADVGLPVPLSVTLDAPELILIQVDGFLDARGNYTLSWSQP